MSVNGNLFSFVTERGRDFLKERFVAAVIVDLGADTGRFALQPESRRGIEHAPHAVFRQISQRRLTTSRTRERNIGAERFRQNRRIDPDLRNVAVRFGAREKFAVALIDENVEHRFFERGIGRMTVRFPIAIDQIDLDATRQRLAAVDLNRGIAKIRPGFAVPGAELDDVDLVAGRGNKVTSEISRKPARLQLELVWNSRRDKQRALPHARRGAHIRRSSLSCRAKSRHLSF